MKIEIIKPEEIDDAACFIIKSFNEFPAVYYTENGANYLYEIAGEESIRKRFLDRNLIYVIKNENIITGYVELQNPNHLFLLFVGKEFQKNGIARRLVNFSLNVLVKNNSDLEEVTVNSTPYASGFYEKLGFEKIADFQLKNGILSFPMKIKIR